MFKKLKKILNEASIVDRKDYKTALKACLSVIAVAAVIATTILLTATTAPVLPVLAGVAAWAGIMATATVTATTDTLKEDVKAGRAEIEWETRLGQKIRSSVAQQKDLQWAQKELLKATPDKFASIRAQFKAVADKVTVVQDLKVGGNGKFRFAQRKPA